MKKLIVFLLLLLIPIISYAQNYKIKDINLEIEIDDNYYVFTRDNLKNNPGLEKVLVSEEEMLKYLESKSVYLDAIHRTSGDWELSLLVTEADSDINNLSSLSKDLLEKTGEGIQKKFNADDYSIYSINDLKFISVDYYDSASNRYVSYYFTVVNSHIYSFILYKKNAISSEEKKEYKKIIDNVKINVLDDYKDEPLQKEIDAYKSNSNYKYLWIIFIIIIAAIIYIVFKKKRGK